VTTRFFKGEEKAQLGALLDEDIARTAENDPNNPILTETDLAKFKLAIPSRAI
jgi:hypothetical protein